MCVKYKKVIVMNIRTGALANAHIAAETAAAYLADPEVLTPEMVELARESLKAALDELVDAVDPLIRETWEGIDHED